MFIPSKDNDLFQEILDDVIIEYQSLYQVENQDLAAERKVIIFFCLKKPLTIF